MAGGGPTVLVLVLSVVSTVQPSDLAAEPAPPGCSVPDRYSVTVSSIPFVSDDLLPEGTATYNTSTVAKGLGVSQSKVLQMLRDHQLIAVRRGGDIHVPRLFFGEVDGRFSIAKHFTGLLNVLRDGGFTDAEVMSWLFQFIDDLDGAPAELIHTDSAREVIRRAQSMAF